MRPEDFDENEPAVPGVELKGGEATWRQYAGKVVAIADGEVRAFGETWGAALSAAKRAGLALDQVEFMLLPDATIIG